MINSAVIIAAGQGRRLNYCSKAMIPVAGKALITYGLDALRECRINDVIIIYRSSDSEIQNLLKDYHFENFHLRFIEDTNLKGPVFAHMLFHDLVSYPVLTMDCDLILQPDSLNRMLIEYEIMFRNTKLDAAIAIIDHPIYENNHSVLLSGDIVTEYKHTGLENGLDAGYIYVWNKSIVPNIQYYYSCAQVRKRFSSFFEYFVSEHRVGGIHIDYLWDVDTPEMVASTEAQLRMK